MSAASAGPAGTELMLSRWYNAPVARVFEAFTQSELLRQWWGPRGNTPEVLEFPAAEGSSYRVVTRGPDGVRYEHVGEFLKVIPEERLCYTWRWIDGPLQREDTLVDLRFSEERGGTRVKLVHSRFVDAASRDSHVGWFDAFERLEEWLSKLSQLD